MASQDSPQIPIALNNSMWRLERWEHQGTTTVLIPETEISLRFENNQVNGSGGCNRFGGSYRLVDSQLSLGVLEATQMGCDQTVMAQETQFLTALQSVYRIRLDESGYLLLSYTLEAEEGGLYFAPIQ